MATSLPERLYEEFPRLRSTPYRITSPQSRDYNCFAWAVGEDDRRWDPDPLFLYYWPPELPRECTLSVVAQAFMTRGFSVCAEADLEEGYEKIAVYVDPNGKPTHAARQLQTGRWTSKLGDWEDIEHALRGLEDSSYGSIACFLKRPTS